MPEGRGGGVKRYKFLVTREINPGDVTYSIVTIANTDVWYIDKLLRE